MDQVLLNRDAGVKIPQQQADDQAQVAENQGAASFGVETAGGNAHGVNSFSASIVETVPNHQGHFDHDHGDGDGKQIPTPEMIDEKAVFKEGDGHQAGGDSGDAGGAAAMLKKALIDELAEEGNLAEDVSGHLSFSR